MTALTNRLQQFAATGLSLLLANTAFAQDDRWFKIELLIFSHESESAPMSETWDPSPGLAYPNASRFLVNLEEFEANLLNYDATGTVDEFGRQLLVINPPPPLDEFGEPLLPDEPVDSEPEIIGEITPVAEAESGHEADLTELPMEETEPLLLTPTPFIRLAGADMTFRGKSAYMQRTGRYQILFHEAWVQPVVSEDRALPIVVDRSGDTGEWPRLQGSIRIYLSRYLHMETNLWLNTAGKYLPDFWQMTPAPLGPPSLIIEYPEPPELLAEPEALAMIGALPGLQGLDNEDMDGGVLGIIEEEPIYPWRHAVLLQQKRRMRSTEVHYIDHPMLGVVALILPLSDEELDAMATAEIAPELDQLPE